MVLFPKQPAKTTQRANPDDSAHDQPFDQGDCKCEPSDRAELESDNPAQDCTNSDENAQYHSGLPNNGLPILIAVVLLDDLLEPPRKPFVRLRLLLQNIAGKDHVILVRFHHVGHPLVRRRANRRHGGLRFLIGLHTNLVDPVRHILLLRGFQGFGQSIVQNNTLLRVRLQLVDQNHLRRRLVLQ